MKYEIKTASEWLYPDSAVSAVGESEIRLDTPKAATASCQVLFNGLTPGDAVEWRFEGCPHAAGAFRLRAVYVEKNTGAAGFCAEEGESAEGYTTRKAPFHVYDAMEPVSAGMTVGSGTEGYYLAFEIGKDAAVGVHSFKIAAQFGESACEIPVELHVYNVTIPGKETLMISNWFFPKVMARQHNVEMWSEAHWQSIRQYGLLMRRARQTHFMIPNEAIEEKKLEDGSYSFDFHNAKRLIVLFLSMGFSYIEGRPVAHRISFKDDCFVTDCAGKTERSLSPEGYDYISRFLKAWRDFLAENGWLDILCQHVADEPTEACANEYRLLAGIVRRHLPGVRLMEAVETYDLDGAVDICIPKNNYYQEHMQEFERVRQNGDELWFYTCCIPGGHFLNRLWDMPLIRTRLLHWGNLLYDLKGYLHWGFNCCDEGQDPFHQEDLLFPPGDTHLVYPGENGPLSSMRLEAMRLGIQDYELLAGLQRKNKPLAEELVRQCLTAFDQANECPLNLEETRRSALRAAERESNPEPHASRRTRVAGESGVTLVETRVISSLVKVFADEPLDAPRYEKGSALLGEYVSLQLAYLGKHPLDGVTVEVSGPLKERVTLSQVGLVPSELPQYHDHDDFLLRTTPGLYPDSLLDLEPFRVIPGQWRSVWVYIDTKGMAAGEHSFEFAFRDKDGAVLSRELWTLEMIGVRLGDHGLKHTEWFYLDCIGTHHNVPILSDEHFALVEAYLENYAEHGMNTILTPLFSPPLEMDVGGDRPTVQLVGVKADGNRYTFDFTLLKRFVGLCLEKGIRYFEMSHLFTQWGAAYAPKVMAQSGGEYGQIFGWDTPASSEPYQRFLEALLKALAGFIDENGLRDNCFLHVSDEPSMNDMESYKKARGLIEKSGLPCPVIDALSDYDFYRQRLVDIPVASTEHIPVFIENKVPRLWAYYCCCEYKGLSNRFFNMPPQRTRIIGFQLYKYGIEGFLHWGYNHWYSCRSRKVIDPYRVTDALLGFPSGDAFLVYPGEKGPVSSVRLKLMQQAFQDIAACKRLEELAGREAVLAIIDGHTPITFTEYPREARTLLAMRETINRRIKEAVVM